MMDGFDGNLLIGKTQAKKYEADLSDVHCISLSGFGESNVKRYNAGRPQYIDEAIYVIRDLLLPILEDETNPVLLELGAGTGKFTESLFRHENESQFSWLRRENYIAVDPSASFLESLSSSVPGVRTLVTSSSHLNSLADESVSAILIAQAFHWMASADTLRECHRVLKRGHPLILIWNTFDLSQQWLNRVEAEVVDPYYPSDGSVPRYTSGDWVLAFRELGVDFSQVSIDRVQRHLLAEVCSSATTTEERAFSPLHYWSQHWSSRCSVDRFLQRISSVSVISALSEEGKTRVLAQVRDILQQSNLGSDFELPYRCDVVWCHRQ